MSERGQSLVETVMVVPACVLAAVALVDVGLVLRDQIALQHAAAAAGVARLRGESPEVAARRQLPPSLGQLTVADGGGRIRLQARSSHAPFPVVPLSASVAWEGAR